ncbi:MAG: porin family protein [Gallionella sp.]
MKLANSACWLLLGFMLAANGANAQDTAGAPSQAAGQNSQKPAKTDEKEQMLADAEALMKAGKPELAYKLLEPFEFERSGEVRFDYLIGIAALDSGKPDKATLALERVLAEDPNYAGARIEMARAYFQLGDMQRAKTEFETVLDENPSDASRVTIQEYLDDIAERESRTHISGYVEGKVGRDTNVNNASDFPNNVITPTLVQGSEELPDNYLGVTAGGEVNHDLNADFRLYAGADISKRNYYQQKNYDSFGAEERAGMIYGTETNRYRVGLLGGQNSLGAARYYDTAGVNGEWRHMPSASKQISLFGQYVRYRYADPALQLNDINQLVAGVGVLRILGDGKSALSGSFYLGTESDVGPATAARPAGGRTDGAKHFVGLRAGGQAAVGGSVKLFFSAGEQVGYFGNENPVISGHRLDRLGDLTIGIDWYLDNLWMVRPQLVRYINTSNIAAYSYDRNDYAVTIRRSFK